LAIPLKGLLPKKTSQKGQERCYQNFLKKSVFFVFFTVLTRIFVNNCAKMVVHIAAAPYINPTTNVNREVVLKTSLISIWYGKVYAVGGQTAGAGHYRHHAFSWAAESIGAA
jgi:hypothetical protein